MHYGRRYPHCTAVFVNRRKRKRNRCRRAGRDLLIYCSLAPTVGVTWPRQSGISGPRSTAPAEVRGGASFCSTAAAGSSAGALSGSTARADAGDILFGSAAAAAGCTSFSSTVGGLSGSTVVSGAADTLFGSTAAQVAPHSAQPPAPCLAQLRRRGPGTSYSPQRRPQVAPHSAQPPASYSAQALQPVVPPASL